MGIPCPKCGCTLMRVEGGERKNGTVIQWMRVKDVNCDCGYSESFEWINPAFQSSEDRTGTPQ
jgi:predicted nucleic-acid-binding Zn-ribbon protein